MSANQSAIAIMAVAAVAGTSASGAIIEYTDSAEWFDASGDTSAIDFTGYPDLTEITGQYADLGVLFPEFEVIAGPSPSYVTDGWGLDGAGPIDMEFDVPIQSVGVDFPGVIAFSLWRGDEFIGASGFFSDTLSTFAGVWSDEPFDRVQIYDPIGSIAAIDNLYFTSIVPGPGGIAAFFVSCFAASRGRRRRA